MWGWRGRDWRGPWPGRGPFSYLPPWERPGWLYGRGRCWWLYASRPYPVKPTPATELVDLEAYAKDLKQELEGVEARIRELRGTQIEKED
ncbi:MAG: DUF5320 domain-containing protein [Candidatus Hodarchaeaceae archaeon]|nr:DUF5320 domain-containing protein [Candidatus Hodarchaeaceae archaeon]